MYEPVVLFAMLFAFIVGIGVLYYLGRIAKDIRAMRKNTEPKFIGGSAGSSPQPQR
jgi:hypothetical protein